jgi:hypothetical protein
MNEKPKTIFLAFRWNAAKYCGDAVLTSDLNYNLEEYQPNYSKHVFNI